MYAIVIACKVVWTVILYRILLAIVFTKLNNCVVYTRSKGREWFLEVTSGSGWIKCCDCFCHFAIWCFVSANIVNLVIFAFSENVKFSANTVFFKVSTTSSLVLCNFIPHSWVSFISEISWWGWEMAPACVNHIIDCLIINSIYKSCSYKFLFSTNVLMFFSSTLPQQ